MDKRKKKTQTVEDLKDLLVENLSQLNSVPPEPQSNKKEQSKDKPKKEITKQSKAKPKVDNGFSYIFLLPSETEKAVVCFRPNLNISAFIPPLTRILNVAPRYDYYSLSKNTKITSREATIPHNVWSQKFLFKKDSKKFRTFFRLHGVEPSTWDKKDHLVVKYLGGPHVHSSGSLCWGGVDRPRNLRHASNRFWNSNFEEVSNNSYKIPNDHPSVRNLTKETYGNGNVTYRDKNGESHFYHNIS